MTSDTPRPDCVSLVSRALAALALLAPLDAPLLLTRKGVPRQSLGRVLRAGDQTPFLPQTRNLENVSVWDDVLVGSPWALLPLPYVSARTRPVMLLSSLIIHRCLSSLHK